MKRLIVPLILYAVLIALVFGGALWPDAGMLIHGDDIHRQYYFYREFFNHWLRLGIIPWWNPSIFGGQPYIADPVVNIWYPPTWMYVVMPLHIAYSWHLAIHIGWAMLGMYVLRANKRNFDVPAWIGGVVFGLSGFFMARTFAGHVDVIAAASWMPWVVGAFWRLMRTDGVSTQHGVYGKSHQFVLASVFFAIQLLAGYQTMAFFTVIGVGVFAIGYSIRVKNSMPTLRVLLAGALGLALAAIQIIPEQEFFGRSIRMFTFPYAWHAYGSWEIRSLLQFLNPFQFGNQYTYHGPPPNFIEHSTYVGLFGLVLSLTGILMQFRKKLDTVARIEGVSFVLLAFFGIWISLGPNAPIDLQRILWNLVPMYHHLRIPPRHIVLIVFGLSGLASIGLRAIRNQYFQILIGMLVVIELVSFGKGFIELKPIPEARHETELISLLQSDATLSRILPNYGVWLSQRDALDFDATMTYGIASATGYDPSILRSYYEFVDALNKSARPSVVDHDVQVPYMNMRSPYISFLGIRHLIIPTEFDPIDEGMKQQWSLVRESKEKDYRVYKNLNAFDRFFFVQNVEFYKTSEPIIAKLHQDVDLGATSLIRDRDHDEGEVALPCKVNSHTTKVESFTPNKIVLSVYTPCDAYLSSSEVFYPGWHAKIDGYESHIYESNIAFRTLFVPAGKHTIIYEYIPTIFMLGGLVSLGSLCVLIWIGKRSN